MKAGTEVEGLLPRAEAELGEGFWALWRLQGGKRHHKLGANLLFWMDKGSMSHWCPGMGPHPNAGTQIDVQGRNDPAEKHARSHARA